MKSKDNLTPLFALPTQPLPDAGVVGQEPLAYQMAPQDFSEYVGQEHILGEGRPLRTLIEQDRLFSLILWGPPGCGKTSLARLIAQRTRAAYVAINAVTAKIADIKQAVEYATMQKTQNLRTLLFVDEIHRFNKAQQDALLPDVESGLLTFIGATTENPYFSVIPGLLSRAQIFEFHSLAQSDLRKLVARLSFKMQPDGQPLLTDDAIVYLLEQAKGDARKLINLFEISYNSLPKTADHLITKDLLQNLTQSQGLKYNEDDHYDLVSAFIKSLRGSDPDAAIYWLARMLKGGEDPLFIARRLVILASEDVGNADPQALPLAIAGLEAVKNIGMPEVRINLAQVTAYLATAPKSNAAYLAINRAYQAIEQGELYPVPKHLRDSHYSGAQKLGFGEKYLYPHDFPSGLVKQQYWSGKQTLYEPKALGFEKEIGRRLTYIKQIQAPNSDANERSRNE